MEVQFLGQTLTRDQIAEALRRFVASTDNSVTPMTTMTGWTKRHTNTQFTRAGGSILPSLSSVGPLASRRCVSTVVDRRIARFGDWGLK
jgi:hypothetical protein